jgi:hypothetical protein
MTLEWNAEYKRRIAKLRELWMYGLRPSKATWKNVKEIEICIRRNLFLNEEYLLNYNIININTNNIIVNIIIIIVICRNGTSSNKKK